MNSTQRMKFLKNELKALKKVLDKNNNEVIMKDIKWGNANYYRIFTNDGKEYIIGLTTSKFPNINFNNIVYIYKNIVKLGLRDYDIYKGEFDISKDYEYPQRIREKFNITETIWTGQLY